VRQLFAYEEAAVAALQVYTLAMEDAETLPDGVMHVDNKEIRHALLLAAALFRLYPEAQRRLFTELERYPGAFNMTHCNIDYLSWPQV